MKFSLGKALVGFTIVGLVIFGLQQSRVVTKAADDVTICHATSSNTNPYNVEHPDKSADVSGHDGHNGGVWFVGVSNWGDIIPPFDYQTYDVVGSHQEIDKYVCPSDASSYTSLDSTKDCKLKIDKTWFYADKVATYKTVNDYAWVTHHYAGKNWDQEGQAVWNNSCNIPAVDCDGDYDSATPDSDDAKCSVSPTVAPTVTPTPTPSNGGGSTGGDGLSDGLGCASHDCSNHPSTGSTAVLGASTGPQQAVLGASTMAGTGTFENTLMDIMLVVGTIVLGAGLKSYAKEKKS